MIDDSEFLKHNYLERRHRAEQAGRVGQPLKSPLAGLAALFDGDPGEGLDYEQMTEQAERFALDSCICADGKPMSDEQQKTPGVEHRATCPNFEAKYLRGHLMVAMTVCDIDREKVRQVLHVLEHLRTSA